jgi:excisionase family DNA binding protein
MAKRGRPARPRIDPATLPKPVMTVDETAVFLRIGRRQAYEAANNGSLPVRRFGRTIRVILRDLEDNRPGEPTTDRRPGLAVVR